MFLKLLTKLGQLEFLLLEFGFLFLLLDKLLSPFLALYTKTISDSISEIPVKRWKARQTQIYAEHSLPVFP